MALSETLFTAILAMDAYNRGYDPGMGQAGVGLGGLSSRIGNAVVGKSSNIDPRSAEVAASFYAQSYTWNGKTIISYRGTDNVNALSLGASDLWH